jgi:hypothetical protein
VSDWFERDPARFAREVRAWRAEGFVVDRDALAAGVLRLTGRRTVDGTPEDVAVEYPDAFPYARPELTLPARPITPTARHRMLRGGLLCLRATMPDEWSPSDLGVDLLPDLDRWLRSARSGVWENEHDAPDLQLLPRPSIDAFLFDAAFLAASSIAVGRLTIQTHPRGGTWGALHHVLRDTTGRETTLTLTRDATQAYDVPFVRLPHAPLGLARLYDEHETAGTQPTIQDVIQTLDAEFPEERPSHAVWAVYGKKIKHWNTAVRPIALQFPLDTGRERQWVWEALVCFGEDRRCVPARVHYASDMFNRVRHVVDLDRLRTANVAVLGVGAVGATVAMSLAQAGVGTLTLIDNDRVNVGNLVRHRADIYQLGLPKTVAMRQLLLDRFPQMTVHSGIADNFIASLYGNDSLLRELAASHDALAVCVGNENLHLYLNRIFLETSTPAVYGWVYPDAVAGRVVRVLPGRTGCIECATEWIARYPGTFGRAPEIADVNALPLDYGCNMPAVAGTAIDHDRIASALARQVVQVLLGENATYPYDPKDHLLLTNRPLADTTGADFESSRAWPLPPWPFCAACGTDVDTPARSLEDNAIIEEFLGSTSA